MSTGAAEFPAAASPESDSTTHEARVAELKAAMPQWLNAAEGVHVAPARNPSLPTLVGLLILVMCFFVVLTSISMRNDKREQSVMSGLAQTFAKTGMAPSSPVGEEAETRKLMGDLRAALNAEVPLETGVKPETADNYVMTVPRAMVFADDGVSLASRFPDTLNQVVHALKTGPLDFQYEVEVAVSAPQMDTKAITGASNIAAALRQAGFANDAASVSLMPGDGQTVALTIRLRPNARSEPTGQPGAQP